MPNLTKIVVRWLPLALVCIVLSGLVYVTVQQNFRMSANDPQIQIAEDVANSLSAGNTLQNVFSGNVKVDMAKSLAPFAMAFDNTAKIQVSTAAIDGQVPVPPAGVFDTKQWGKLFGSKDQNRFTWQPKAGVRIAAVLVKYQSDKASGYVLAGRNLREVENREAQLTVLVGIGLLISLAGSFATIWGLEFWKKKMKHE